MIEIASVTHRYGAIAALTDVTLCFSERRVAVIGANGSGKSTLARLLNGLLVPTAGRVVVDGLDTRTHGRAVRRRVGFVFQNPDTQIVMPTVAEDLAFGLRPLKLAPTDSRRRVDAALSRWGLDRYRDHPAHLLSAGEKQLLAIAGVLITEPDYVVFDEPTTMLDLRNKRRIARLIDGLPQVAIVVSHDLDLLAGFERVVVLDRGRVAADDRPAAAIAAYLRLMA